MPTLAKKSYIVSVLSLVVAVGSLWVAYKSIQVSKQLAEASGSLDKPGIEVGLSGYPLTPNTDSVILIGAPVVSSEKAPAIGFIPFTIKSTGKKTLESIYISFQYHEFFQRNLLELMNQKISGPFSPLDIKKSTTSEDDRFFASYTIQDLNPGVNLRIEEPIFLFDSEFNEEIQATTKDGILVNFPVKGTYATKFGFNVSARDSQILGYPLSVSIHKVKSIDDLMEGPLNKHISNRQLDLRNRLSLLSYLAALITSSASETVFLVYIPLSNTTSGDTTIYATTDQPEVVVAQYSLLDWELLANYQE
jgi:hypothetical protein